MDILFTTVSDNDLEQSVITEFHNEALLIENCARNGNIVINTYPKTSTYISYKIAVKINGVQNFADYEVKFETTDGSEQQKLQSIGQYYICDIDSVYTNPGTSNIIVYERSKNKPIWIGTILVYPSNIAKEFFPQMLNEISAIKFELLYSLNNDTMGTMFVNESNTLTQYALLSLEKELHNIKRILVRINRNPMTKQIYSYQFVNKANIKNITPDIMAQYVANMSRSTYKVCTPQQSVVTYENTIIKYCLMCLMENIQSLEKYIVTQNVEKEKNLEKRLCNIIKRGNNVQDVNVFKESLLLQKSKLPNIENYKKTLKNILDIINEILQLKMFSQIKVTRSVKQRKLKLTQIFSNDNNYREVYKFLRKVNNYYNEHNQISFDRTKKKILLEKLPTLYEYWILIRIFRYLLHLGFKPTNNISEMLNKAWNHKKKLHNYYDVLIEQYVNNEPGFMEKFTKDDIVLTLFYDTALGAVFNAAEIDFYDSDASNLRPDYLLIVENDKKKHIFILDAKYRQYDNMRYNGESYWLNKDIKEVAKYKYMDKIWNECNVKIAGSFIVHTDTTSTADNDSLKNPNSYLGKFVSFDIDNDVRFMKIPGVHVADTHGSYKYGSFYMAPGHNDSEQNLGKFFNLIFEYFMEEWDAYCWQCGSKIKKENIKPLKTMGNYTKYHITCDVCGNFIVKNHHSCSKNYRTTIIKHDENYFIEQSNDKWFLKCPNCGK